MSYSLFPETCYLQIYSEFLIGNPLAPKDIQNQSFGIYRFSEN